MDLVDEYSVMIKNLYWCNFYNLNVKCFKNLIKDLEVEKFKELDRQFQVQKVRPEYMTQIVDFYDDKYTVLYDDLIVYY